MRLSLLFAAAIAVLPTATHGAETYICVGDQSTGFFYDDATKEWRQSSFRTDNDRFVVRRPNDRADYWDVTRTGDDVPLAECKKSSWLSGVMSFDVVCRGAFEFRMNRKTLRFLSANLSGYYNESQSGDSGLMNPRDGTSTPTVTIGKCARL
jgi:hypothetical protein